MTESADERVATVWSLAQQDLAGQLGAIDELRARVGSLLAAATIATSFLSAESFHGTKGFPFGAWLAIVSALGLLSCCIFVLWPQTWAGMSTDTTLLLDHLMKTPAQSIDGFLKDMAGYARTAFVSNGPGIKRLYWAYVMALVFLAGDFAGWFLALTQ